MKTIEEKAKEYGLEVSPHSAWTAKNAETSFKSGVEFAQRWIPVEEKNPERNKNVILKRSKPFDKYEITGFQRDGAFYSNETAIKLTNVTHWRPIELI